MLLSLKEGKQKRRLRDEVELESYLLNDFERVLFLEYPVLGQMAKKMRDAGIRRPLLSGSGSAMFGFTESDRIVRKAITEVFPVDQYEVFWTQTYQGGPRQIANTLSANEIEKILT